MIAGPIAVGGIGGSGTRIIAGNLQRLGVFIGSDLPPSIDTIWYSALFGRRDVLLQDQASLSALVSLFSRQMSAPRPLSAEEMATLLALRDQTRHQRAPEMLRGWMDSFIAHADTGQPQPLWGWKLPYTHILIDRLLQWMPDLKYVHITRNGLDMAFSGNQNQLAQWGPLLLDRDVSIGPRDSLAFWCAVHRRMARITALFPDRIFHLDYDQMLRDPAPTLAAMFTFLGADLPPARLDRFAAAIRPPATVGRHLGADLSVFDSQDMAYVQSLADASAEQAARP